MKTRWLDIILGHILLGFVLFAFNVDGSVVSAVFVSNAERNVERRFDEKRAACPDQSLWFGDSSNLVALFETEDQAETFGSNSLRSRSNRGCPTFSPRRSSSSPNSRSVLSVVTPTSSERFQRQALFFDKFLSSILSARPLFLVLLKLRN